MTRGRCAPPVPPRPSKVRRQAPPPPAIPRVSHWVELREGQPVSLSRCEITVGQEPPPVVVPVCSEGLPPLPKSLCVNPGRRPAPRPPPTSTLDLQLAILRQEMAGLRQLDVSLLSQLCSLNQSIQEFRAMILQEDADELPNSRPLSEMSSDEQQSCSSA
ncbi:leucine rich adaptor protein 1-like [Neocloeon triangulifer]|uniref:leucine rich adaptor protein 1-like n=1 Tax=Neocloeon triangulifer TaxID=2078957 RepID=UPI00286FA623|nr:leucine rich adaptor protein 1-like [Neocloeon triangulifer]